MMNERTLELYKLAHVPPSVIDPSNNMPYETNIFSAEKFSELIVKECIKIADNRGAYEVIDDIIDHFGVEE